ncbi:MAG: ABC transporter permease, partial [Candidatus Sericytochromatia bacterium]
MINNLELFIALKQLKAKWKQTSLATLSVSVGVMILICALSLTNGFEKDLVDKILGNNPHITVESALSDRIPSYKEFLKKISKIDGVTSATPVIRGQALLNNGLEVKGILVYGIDPDLENKSSGFYKSVKKGALVNDETSIVLGAELAKKIGASIGDTVQIVTGVGI